MGIDTQAVIVVGYTYDEIYSVFNEIEYEIEYDIDFTEWCEDNELESISPYYDASREDCLFGTVIFTTGDYSYETLDINELVTKDIIEELADKFGKVPNVYLSPYVW